MSGPITARPAPKVRSGLVDARSTGAMSPVDPRPPLNDPRSTR